MKSGAGRETLAIVPARSGSKGLPGKNLRPFLGRPLLAHSIATARSAQSIDRVIVSTDDEQIAQVARSYGAEVPFLRPHELAQDDSPDYPVFEHALRWLEKHEDYKPELVVQLRPTSPLRPATLVDDALNLIESFPNADCVRSVTIPKQNPFKMWQVEEEKLRPLLGSCADEMFNRPRQSLPKVYWQTGHIDVIRYETIIRKRTLTGDTILPLFIDQQYCVDIDSATDLDLAEWLVNSGSLSIDLPLLRTSFPLPDGQILLVLDFDGVLTDNRVLISETGTESVICSRSDGEGLARLKAHGVEIIVISAEVNAVVSARCKKLGLLCFQGVRDKEAVLREIVSERQLDVRHVIFVGNDLSDLACINIAGCGVAVSDAQPEVIKAADWVLKNAGGRGAVRELCDLLVSSIKRTVPNNE